jgi:NADPH:quinone reductase-like Zn-dependent oxidoreductase
VRVYEVRQFGIESSVLAERAEPQPRASEVVIKFHAASLDYRDLMFVRGTGNPEAIPRPTPKQARG